MFGLEPFRGLGLPRHGQEELLAQSGLVQVTVFRLEFQQPDSANPLQVATLLVLEFLLGA